MGFTNIDNFPVAFNYANDTCNNSFDEREYCQMVEQTDLLTFAWKSYVIVENTLYSSTFEDEASSMSDWNLYSTGFTYSSDELFSGICGGMATTLPLTTSFGQTGVVTSTGVWKVVVTVPMWTDANLYDGTFTVTAGDATSAATDVSAGQFTFYLNVTSGSDFTFNLISGRMCIDSIALEKICNSYEIQVKDKDYNYISTITSNITRYNDVFVYSALWSTLSLPDGCYRLCIVNKCSSDNTEKVTNGNFASGASWSTGTGWSIGSGVATSAASTGGTLTQTLTLKPNTKYLVSWSILNGSSPFGASGSLGGTSFSVTPVTGSYSTTVLTGSNPTNIVITTSSFTNAGFDIDNISVKEAESVCSECYDLKSNHLCTTLLSWSNDDDAYGIPYSSATITHNLRCFALLDKPKYPKDKDRFRFSNGRGKVLYSESQKIYKLNFDDLPEYLHDAIAIGIDHDHFYINGIEYICSSDNYEPEWRGRMKLVKSNIDVQKIIDTNKNRNC